MGWYTDELGKKKEGTWFRGGIVSWETNPDFKTPIENQNSPGNAFETPRAPRSMKLSAQKSKRSSGRLIIIKEVENEFSSEEILG